ncbi:MMPL family transporter [Micromonospora sp. WMMD961]|uniref:MMPL family transporter n=1 Tax=Micromonospora sp. WMMD961 TaxID=3016100 RepID=UPI002416EFA4|nr:MMPL family transporter [Micromonospora sp. WMMD961]MDG4778728.1 MMPL family transporter [Micromonospora sp. WMMD961]
MTVLNATSPDGHKSAFPAGLTGRATSTIAKPLHPALRTANKEGQSAMPVLARWCFRHRFLVIGSWVALLVALALLSATVGTSYSNAFSLPGTESAKAQALLQKVAPQQAGDSGQIVVHVRDGSIRDAEVRAKITPMLEKVAALPSVASVTSMYGSAGAPQISKDGRTAYATVTFDATADRLAIPDVTKVIDTAHAARDDQLQVELGGEAIAIAAEGAIKSTEAVGVVAAGIVLFIAFGSLVGMLLPLLAAIAALSAGLITVGLTSHLMILGSIGPTVAALIGLGVGIDYALFIVSRHRAGLQAGLSPEDAAVRALDTAGRAVVFAGLTVIAALLGLLVLRIGPLNGMGISGAIAVLFTVVAAVTLLPALLGVFGAKLLNKRQRRALATPDHDSPPPSGRRRGRARRPGRWAERVERRKTLFALGAVLLVALLSLPALSLRLGNSDAGNDPKGSTTRAAYDLLAQSFGPGSNGPLVLVTQQGSSGDGQALQTLISAVRVTPGVASVVAEPSTASTGLSVIHVVPTTAPQDKATDTLVTHLREDVIPAAVRGSGLTVHVGGATAGSADLASVVTGKLPLFLAVIIGLGFVLLMVAFRSILVPLTAALMNLLASAASFGVVVAVFQWGWGSEFMGLGKAGPVQAELPLILLAILFGLSMDYQVFLVSRMHEEWTHSRDNHQAIRVGQTETGRLINAAALIMICVFTAFVFGGQRVIAEYGVGLAAAVAIDAFILRTALVPALMHLLGRSNWWLPGWLDRILPQVSVEGASAPQRTPVAPVIPVPVANVAAAAGERFAASAPVVSVPTAPSVPVTNPAAAVEERFAVRDPKSVGVAYLWWLFLGLFGGHHFYLRQNGRGALRLCTLGLCGLGWLADMFILPRQVREANARITSQRHRPSPAAATANALPSAQ